MAIDTATGEDIDGFWVDPATGALYLSSYDFFTIGVGVAGDKHDLCVRGVKGETPLTNFQRLLCRQKDMTLDG